MSSLLPPRVEGAITLRDGRRLWFHGTPGSRRQIPQVAREVAAERGVRLLALERPGIGGSTAHLYSSVLGWADDVEEFASRMGLERFGLVGLSGGGPYVLACAYRLPGRVVADATPARPSPIIVRASSVNAVATRP